MKISAGTVAPTLVVLATIGWLLRLYFDPPEGLDVPKMAAIEIANSLLSPGLDPLPARNPFRLAGEADEPSSPALTPAPSAMKGRATPESRATKGQATPESRATKGPVVAASKPLGGLADRLRRLAESLKSQAERARRNQADLGAKIDGKARLSATSIQGNRRVAILNGRAYSQGEAIDWETGLAGPIIVAEVRPASVMLRSRGAQVEVFFPLTSVATAPPPPVAAAKPVSKRSTNARKNVGLGSGRPR